MAEKAIKEFNSYPEKVWDVLSRIDVQDHIDTIEATSKRPAVNYLSWSMAWTLAKRKFPASTYAHRPDLRHPDGTVEVEVDVIISDDGHNQQFTNARLGVMDFFFNPIPNPTARQVNDARQRALVKALAFAGLGLNLWTDGMLPVGRYEDPISEAQCEEIESLIEATGTNRENFLNWVDVSQVGEIPIERFASAVGLLRAKQQRQAMEKAEKDLRGGK